VRDTREEAFDKAVAKHIVNLHMQRTDASNQPDIEVELLTKYLTYAKTKIFPRIPEEVGHMLQDMYVTDRMSAKEQAISKSSSGIPITVRQLEAIIRLSESIARMHLSTEVKPQHVQEAHRIFKVSTMNAAASGMSSANTEAPAEL